MSKEYWEESLESLQPVVFNLYVYLFLCPQLF